jgi:hypothetical protein
MAEWEQNRRKAAPQSAAPKRNDMKFSLLDFLVPANRAALTDYGAPFKGENQENSGSAELSTARSRGILANKPAGDRGTVPIARAF